MTLEELLNEVCYLKSYKGYSCLVSCVERVKEDETRLCEVRNRVYLPVAEEQGVKLQNLEKNLRTVRDAFQIHGGMEILRKHLGGEKEYMIYPRELIEALAECTKKN